MQSRLFPAKAADIPSDDIVVFDPLSSNTDEESLRVLDGLILGNPGVKFFEASRVYQCRLPSRVTKVSLTTSLKIANTVFHIDMSKLDSINAEVKAALSMFLLIQKNNSINNSEKGQHVKDIVSFYLRYPVVYIDQKNELTYVSIKLSDPLVIYKRKKNHEDRRFAVVGQQLSSGSYGQVFMSQVSIVSLKNENQSISIKNKTPEKARIVKMQFDKWSTSRQALTAEIEYEMTRQLAADLAVKPLARHSAVKNTAMLMRYFPGKDLNVILVANELKTDLERLEVCLAAAEELMLVHNRGGIHRDIKPDNFIMIKSSAVNRVKLIDFGLSILETMNIKAVSGTYLYTAPEIFSYGTATKASDVYSLCRTFEVIFGKWPSWEDRSPDLKHIKNYLANAEVPFDRPYINLDSSHPDLLAESGFNTLLTSMRTRSPSSRIALADVIKKLKELIIYYKNANQAVSNSPVDAAAAFAP